MGTESTQSVVKTTGQLTISDLAHVDGLLTRHGFTTANGFKLGLQLGLSPNTLDVIEKSWKEDASRCLWECLKEWLREADNVKSKGGATIPALISALKKIGDHATADGICNESHPACCILKQHLSVKSVVDAIPLLSLHLHKEGIIGTMMVTAGEVLFSSVKESVCADHQNLDKFASVLQKLSSTAAIGTLIRKEYIEKFSDNSTEVHDSNNKSIKVSSVDEFVFMRHTYAQAVHAACKAMNAIPPDDLKKYLRRGYSYLIPQLVHLNTTDDILDVVCGRCSVVNVSLLEAVAHYYKVEEASAIVEKYKKDLQKFKPLRRLLNEELYSGPLLKCEKITFIVNGDVDDNTLDDVQRLLQYAFKELAPHVMIKVIREHNSFIVICSFPLSLSEKLIATAEESIELLKDKGVKKLTVGYCTVFDSEKVSKVEGAQDEEFKPFPSTDQSDKLEQLMLSQNLHLINREQELIHQSEVHDQEIEKLKQEMKLNDNQTQKKIKQMQKDYSTLVNENEELHQKLSALNKEDNDKSQASRPRDPNPIRFQDDIYGDISIDHPLIMKIVKTKEFQRLKDIKKLGSTYQNIPKATYSTLQHSIGMYYLAGKYVKQLQKRQPELGITRADVLCVEIAALCYNLGHGPFSHTFGLFLKEVFPSGEKPWESLSEATVMMFDHMIEKNDEVKDLLEELLDNEDIAFIKDLIRGIQKGQRKGKEFLFEIVVNKRSQLDVCMIDYTTRDAAVLGMNINFKWRVFLSNVIVRKCENEERHIFFHKDDLETYNDLFRTRHIIFRELYYLRKNRVAAVMIKRILAKSDDTLIIRDGDRRVTISEATKSMSAYTQLNDSILDVIKLYVDNPEAQELLDCLNSMKFIGQIGFVLPKVDWDKEQIRKWIIEKTGKDSIKDYLIIDPIKNGYEDYDSLTQYYYTSDGETGQWKQEWAVPPPEANKSPIRIFLVTGDKDLIKEVQKVLQELKTHALLVGEIYPDDYNNDLMNPLPITASGGFAKV